MKTKNWFNKKLKEFENDPEFLNERIDLLESENRILNNLNFNQKKEIKQLKFQILAMIKSANRLRISDDIFQSIDPARDSIEKFRDEANRQTLFYYAYKQKIE